MSGTYDEETRKLLETRKRRAEIRRAQQIKKRNRTLFMVGVFITAVILIIVLSISCSSNKDNEKETVTQPPVTTTEEVTTPEETTNASMYTTDVLNLRKAPGTDADIITQIGAGKKVEILKEEGEWCRVQRGKDIGYVMKKYLSYENTVN